MLNKTLPILISMLLAFAFASNACAQSISPEEVESLLNDCEVIIAEVAEQRNRAIEEADTTAQERDEARGQLLFLIPEYETQKQDIRRLQIEVADKPSRWVWFGIGAGAGIVVTVAAVFALASL